MGEPSIQDLLPLIRRPSRYLGREINRVKKDWQQTDLHVALAFPDLYEIATSHFGIQILYGILNEQPDILAERVFAPAEDMEKQLRKNKRLLFSLESHTPINQFDIIGFSLLYELNYTNMVNMIDLAGLRFFAEQRDERDPLLIAGGPCMCNPEPVADFFDAIVIGDGEPVILEMTAAWKAWQRTKGHQKRDLLFRWSAIEGVYIPSFFRSSSNNGQSLHLRPTFFSHRRVQRSVVTDLNEAFFPTMPVIPFGKPVHDRLRMEIARGCTRGCRFCQAGMIYRPVREREPQQVLDAVRIALEKTGYEDLSLLSLSTGDYACIAPLMRQIMVFGQRDHVAVSLPSLRAGSLTPQLMELIKKVRKTGFTIAPEAGSQRLRDVINKNITEEEIVETVEQAVSMGWKVIKLYFMIGLPTETQTDVEAIVLLVRRLQRIARNHAKGVKINVGVATFVPKAHTPFQWEPQRSLEASTQTINWIKEQLAFPGIQVKWQDPKVSQIEGIWSRGDRRLSRVVLKAWKLGCRFDGWTDCFDYDKWMQAFTETNVDPAQFTQTERTTDQSFPWDHIDMGVDRSFLIAERRRAVRGERTLDCRTGNCSGCGVCDFASLQPVSYHDQKPIFPKHTEIDRKNGSSKAFTYRITFTKLNETRFLGHLEMVKLFVRSFRREKIPLRYSRGFHPMPSISFLDTLPVGMQSEEETMLVKLIEKRDPGWVAKRLARQMPSGMEITGCEWVDKRASRDQESKRTYHIKLTEGFFPQKRLDWFDRQPTVTIEKKSKKDKKVFVDLKRVVSHLSLLDASTLRITIEPANKVTIRPAQAVQKIFDFQAHQILTAIITKRKADHV